MPQPSQTDNEQTRRRLGGALRSLRLAHSLTQDQLANASDIHVTSLRDYEQGRATPSWHTLTQLAGALSLAMSDIGHAYDSAPDNPPRQKVGRPRKAAKSRES